MKIKRNEIFSSIILKEEKKENKLLNQIYLKSQETNKILSNIDEFYYDSNFEKMTQWKKTNKRDALKQFIPFNKQFKPIHRKSSINLSPNERSSISISKDKGKGKAGFKRPILNKTTHSKFLITEISENKMLRTGYKKQGQGTIKINRSVDNSLGNFIKEVNKTDGNLSDSFYRAVNNNDNNLKISNKILDKLESNVNVDLIEKIRNLIRKRKKERSWDFKGDNLPILLDKSCNKKHFYSNINDNIFDNNNTNYSEFERPNNIQNQKRHKKSKIYRKFLIDQSVINNSNSKPKSSPKKINSSVSKSDKIKSKYLKINKQLNLSQKFDSEFKNMLNSGFNLLKSGKITMDVKNKFIHNYDYSNKKKENKNKTQKYTKNKNESNEIFNSDNIRYFDKFMKTTKLSSLRYKIIEFDKRRELIIQQPTVLNEKKF